MGGQAGRLCCAWALNPDMRVSRARAYGERMAAVLDATYLPFTADQLRAHFAPVTGKGDPDRHLAYYLASVKQAQAHAGQVRRGITPAPAQVRFGRQMEKDERFWLATALMSLYHQGGGATRSELFAQLLNRARLRPPGSYASWADALSSRLELFFEVSLPSPPVWAGIPSFGTGKSAPR